jgi:hypothetical protein
MHLLEAGSLRLVCSRPGSSSWDLDTYLVK